MSFFGFGGAGGSEMDINSGPSPYSSTDGEKMREEAEKTFMAAGGGIPLINMDPSHPSNNPPPFGVDLFCPLDD